MTAHPNTVAYSAGAVCCPNYEAAMRHRDAVVWLEPNGTVSYATSLMKRRWTS